MPSPKRLSKRTALPPAPPEPAHEHRTPPRLSDDDAIEREAHAWARVLGAGSPTVQDGEAFKAWRGQSPAHQRAWAQASRAWRELGGVVQAYAAERPAQARPDRRAQAPFSPRRRWLLAGGAGAFASLAAVGLLRPPLGLWPSYAEMQADYRTATGEQRRYALDAQQLTLALNTQTSLNVATRDGRPEIELVAGEAAIQARRDQPCLVKAGAARLLLADGDIEIRRLRGQQVQLRCNAGQLEVRHPQGALRLAAGMQIAYDDDALDAPAPLPARPSDWRARAWSASMTCRWSRRSTRSTATARGAWC